MNRGRQPNDKAQMPRDAGCAPIDLGLSLSVYGRDADGTLVEIGVARTDERRLSPNDTWPTEQ